MNQLESLVGIPTWANNWLTPLWILGLGALSAIVLLLVLWALAWLISRLPVVGQLGQRGWRTDPSAGPDSFGASFIRTIFSPVSRRAVDEIPLTVREGALWPMFVIVVAFAIFGIVGAFLVRDRDKLFASLQRLPHAGTTTYDFTVEVSQAEDKDDQFSELRASILEVAFPLDEVQNVEFKSDQNLQLATKPFADILPGADLDVMAGEPANWSRGEGGKAFIDSDVERFFVRNQGSDSANVAITVVTAPPFPEVATVPVTAIAIVIVFLLYLLQRAMAPRLSAIALATYKSSTSQILFLLLVTVGIVGTLIFVILPYNTFGEDIKMLKDSGLTMIKLLGIFLAVWVASGSIAEEIEGRTALTVLSKPIGRRSFILGKFLGIVWTVAVLFTIVGVVFLIMLAYKPIYDAKENVDTALTWQTCHMEVVYTFPGIALALMEAILLAAISVAISTRLPLLPNVTICFAIYMLGHLTPLLVQSSMGQFVFVRFFGQLIATVFPNLEQFDMQAAVANGVFVPASYLLWTLLYSAIYSGIAMLLALVFFEDRDLA